MPSQALHYFLPALVAMASPPGLAAQVSPLQVELSGGAMLPAQDFADPGGLEGAAERGPSFGLHIALTQGHVSWYVGFTESRTECGGVSCSGDFVSTSWDLGLRLNLLTGPVVPWLRAGATAQIVDGRLTDPAVDPLPGGMAPTFPAESDRAWGVEVGAGVMIRVAERFGINPGVRFTRVNAAFGEPIARELQIRAWVVDLGLVLGF